MNIKPAIYESLTSRQRIVSMIDAMGREDDNEMKRLNKTCKKKTYRMNDAKYSDVLDRLFHTSMALEADLRGMVIGYLEVESTELKNMYIQDISNTNSAWLKLLKEMGINEKSMFGAAPPRHELIDALLNIAPKQEEETTNQILKNMKEYINI